MIKLTDVQQARRLRGRVPDLAILRMEQLAAGGNVPGEENYVVVVEEGDDLERDFPVAGRFGLLSALDDLWGESQFESVRFVRENGVRVYAAVLRADDASTVTFVVPDAPWLDDRLSLLLRVDAPEEEEG